MATMLLVDCVARLFCDGKGAVARAVDEILDRLGSSADPLTARLERWRRGRTGAACRMGPDARR
jgi:hypothetical protein